MDDERSSESAGSGSAGRFVQHPNTTRTNKNEQLLLMQRFFEESTGCGGRGNVKENDKKKDDDISSSPSSFLFVQRSKAVAERYMHELARSVLREVSVQALRNAIRAGAAVGVEGRRDRTIADPSRNAETTKRGRGGGGGGSDVGGGACAATKDRKNDEENTVVVELTEQDIADAQDACRRVADAWCTKLRTFGHFEMVGIVRRVFDRSIDTLFYRPGPGPGPDNEPRDTERDATDGNDHPSSNDRLDPPPQQRRHPQRTESVLMNEDDGVMPGDTSSVKDRSSAIGVGGGGGGGHDDGAVTVAAQTMPKSAPASESASALLDGSSACVTSIGRLRAIGGGGPNAEAAIEQLDRLATAAARSRVGDSKKSGKNGDGFERHRATMPLLDIGPYTWKLIQEKANEVPSRLHNFQKATAQVTLIPKSIWEKQQQQQLAPNKNAKKKEAKSKKQRKKSEGERNCSDGLGTGTKYGAEATDGEQQHEDEDNDEDEEVIELAPESEQEQQEEEVEKKEVDDGEVGGAHPNDIEAQEMLVLRKRKGRYLSSSAQSKRRKYHEQLDRQQPEPGHERQSGGSTGNRKSNDRGSIPPPSRPPNDASEHQTWTFEEDVLASLTEDDRRKLDQYLHENDTKMNDRGSDDDDNSGDDGTTAKVIGQPPPPPPTAPHQRIVLSATLLGGLCDLGRYHHWRQRHVDDDDDDSESDMLTAADLRRKKRLQRKSVKQRLCGHTLERVEDYGGGGGERRTQKNASRAARAIETMSNSNVANNGVPNQQQRREEPYERHWIHFDMGHGLLELKTVRPTCHQIYNGAERKGCTQEDLAATTERSMYYLDSIEVMLMDEDDDR